MIPNKSFIKFLLFITCCCFLLSCHVVPNKLGSFLIKVDSIHVPIVITSNTPFDIEFFGTIAADGCHNFEHFDQSINNKDVMIEAWGSYDFQSGVCPTVMVYLTGHKLTLTIPSPGIYAIKIKQPDDTYLLRQITVN